MEENSKESVNVPSETMEDAEVMSEVHLGCPPNFTGPYTSHFAFSLPHGKALKDLSKDKRGDMIDQEFQRRLLENKKKSLDDKREASKKINKPSKSAKEKLKPTIKVGKRLREASLTSTGSKRPKPFEEKKLDASSKNGSSRKKGKGKEPAVKDDGDGDEVRGLCPLAIIPEQVSQDSTSPIRAPTTVVEKSKEHPKPDSDPLAGFDKFLLENMPQATKDRAQLSEDEDEELGFLEEEGEGIIPSSSQQFDSASKKKMINEMLKCVPEGYTKTLQGYSEAHIGPIMNDIANCLLRMDGIAKMVVANKVENKKNIHLSTMADDYIMQQIELIRMEKQDAINTLSRDLGKTKNDYHECLSSNQRLHARIDELKAEKVAAEERAEKAEERAKKAELRVSDLKSRIHELEDKLSKAKEETSKWQAKAFDSVLDGENAMKSKVAEAWKLVPGDAPFSYFGNWPW